MSEFFPAQSIMHLSVSASVAFIVFVELSSDGTRDLLANIAGVMARKSPVLTVLMVVLTWLVTNKRNAVHRSFHILTRV